MYIEEQQQKHMSFNYEKCGLIIDSKQHFIAASPDGLVHCDCCGKGLAEFKCPFSLKDGGDISPTSLPYIDANGLKEDHEYYYQIMTQLMVTNASYADFCVWTPTSIYIQRILPDIRLFEKIRAKCAAAFKNVILPELLGRKFTTSPELL